MHAANWKRLPSRPPSNMKRSCGKKLAKNPRAWCASTLFPRCNKTTLVNVTFATWYVGIRHIDGRLEQNAEATTSATLVFEWVLLRGDSEAFHECEVRCGSALGRGLPYPETPYCTTTELQQLALKSASAHQTTLRTNERREDIFVMCEYLARSLCEIGVHASSM